VEGGTVDGKAGKKGGFKQKSGLKVHDELKTKLKFKQRKKQDFM